MTPKTIDQEGNVISEPEMDVTAFIENMLGLETATDTDNVRAILFYNPLDTTQREIIDLVWEEGKPLAAYLEGLPEDVDWQVCVGSREIARADWADATLSPAQTIIISVVPNKDILPIIELVAMVVLAVAAPYLIPVIGVVGMTLLTVAVAVGGMLLNAMLAGSKNPDSDASSANSQSYGIDGPKNTSEENIPVPVVYGTMRIAGNKANIYVDNNDPAGLTQILYLMYVIGEGEITNISDVRLNDEPIGNFVQAGWDWRPGTQNQAAMQWFSETLVPVNVQAELGQTHFVWQTSTEADRLRIDVAFPNGLYAVDSKTGAIGVATTHFNCTYQFINADGSLGDPVSLETPAQWNEIDAGPGNTGISVTGLRLTLQAVGNAGEQQSAYSLTAQFNTPGGGWSTIGTDTGFIQNIPVVDANGNITYQPGSLIRVFEATGLPNATYGFQALGGAMVGVEAFYATTLSFTAQQRETFRHSVTTPPLARGNYHLEFWRDDAESTVDTLVNRIEITDINVITDDLINYVNTAYYGVEVALGSDLNGEPSVTALVQGKKVNIYDRNGNINSYGFSSNPADIALDIMLNTRNRFAFNGTRIDWPAFGDWRDYCAETGLNFNGVFDTTSNVWDCLQDVFRIGRASPRLEGLKWSVAVEAPADAVMMFTQDHIVKGSFTTTWTGRRDRANQIEVQYYDQGDDYKQHSVFAIDEEFITQSEPLVATTIQLRGCTDMAQANSEAWLQLNLNRYCTQSVQFDVYLRAMGCTIGDVIYVQHDMPQWGYSSRIVAVSGNTVTIDSEIAFNGGNDWRILIVRGVACLANATLADVSGNQIILGNFASPSTQASDAALETYTTDTGPILPSAGLDPSQILNSLNSYGCDRVLINGHDYAINDWAWVNNQLIIQCDRAVTEAVGSTVEVFKNDLMCEANLVAPSFNQRVLTLNGWLGANGSPRVGDTVMLGEVNQYKKPFRVTSITYKDDHTRTINALEYNETVYGAAAEPTNNYSALSPNPYEVANLQATQVSTQLQGGAMSYAAHFTWDRPLDDPRGYAGAKVYVSANFGPFLLVGDAPNPMQSWDVQANLGDLIRAKVVAYEADSSTADYLTAPIAAVEIGTHSQKPPAVTNVTATGGIRLIALQWDPVSSDFVKWTQVWENSTNDLGTAYMMYEGTANYYVRANLDPNETRTYWVRNVAITGQNGDWTAPVTATSSQLIASDIQDGILDTAKFAASISPVAVVDGVPTTLDQTGGAKIAFNTVDSKIYRWNGENFTALIQATDVPGVATTDEVNTLLNFDNIKGTITSTQITDGSITTPMLASGAITSDKLTAGAVLAENLAVASTNVIWNAAPIFNLDGWSINGYGGVSTASGSLLYDIAGNLFGSSFMLRGLGTGAMAWNNETVLNSSQGFYAAWQPDGSSTSMVVSPGQKVQASAMIQALAISARVDILWIDGNGNEITESNGNLVSSPGYGAAVDLYQYQNSSVLGVAPNGAVAAFFRLICIPPSGGSYRPIVFWTQAMLGLAPVNATEVGDWLPGGVTRITGGVMETGGVVARNMSADSISADSLQANSVIFGKIASGAVRADQIYAGQIRADHLASDFQLTETAQIGDAIITNAKIGDLEVNGQKILGGSVTESHVSSSTAVIVASSESWTSFAAIGFNIDSQTQGVMLMGLSLNDYAADASSDTFTGGGFEGGNGY